MLAAFTSSILFLISYLIYHYQVGSVGFKGQGGIRPVYFTILISHTILAVDGGAARADHARAGAQKKNSLRTGASRAGHFPSGSTFR